MFLTEENLKSQNGIAHGFFTRSGGVSGGLYASLNCAYGTGDSNENVNENHRRILQALGFSAIARTHQVHSANAIIVETPFALEERPKADALVTSTPGLLLGITTADCTPVLLADTNARVVAAVHAGWKGALSGVIESALIAMESLGAQRGHIVAATGPCISQNSYEVGPEFQAKFLEESPEYARFFIPSPKAEHFKFNLPGFVAHELEEADILTINSLARDTCLQEDGFFSYRRSALRKEPAYGCQLSVIGLKE